MQVNVSESWNIFSENLSNGCFFEGLEHFPSWIRLEIEKGCFENKN